MLIGLLAVLMCLGLARYDDLVASRRELIALATIIGVTAAGAIASAARRRREQQLADVTAVAEAAQRVLLRPVPAQVGPAQVAVRYISAAAAARIGGDIYDVAEVGDAVRLIIGDVQGKGLEAIKTAAAVLGAFREAAHDTPDLPRLAERIELSLRRQTGDEEFVTAILAQISADGSRAEILNCGHPPPLLVRGSRVSFVQPREACLPFGLSGLASAERHVQNVALCPGDRLLFYTDGISEARDRSGSFYKIEACAAVFDGIDPEAALDHISKDVVRHVGHPLLDDAALLLVASGPVGTRAAILPDGPEREEL
jgi:serine phosphatase RsbU (regulator of sigma subunit)